MGSLVRPKTSDPVRLWSDLLLSQWLGEMVNTRCTVVV